MQLSLEFGAETEGLDQGTNKAISDVESFDKSVDELQKSLDKLRETLDKGFNSKPIKDTGEEFDKAGDKADGLKTKLGGLAAGIVAAFSVNQVVQWAERMGAASEELNNLSQRLGIGVEDLSAWQAVVNNAGGSAQTFTAATQVLSRNLEEARAGAEQQRFTFEALGIDINKVSSNSQLLIQIADRFKGMPDGPEKTALAMDLLGRSGAELIPVFNQGGDAIVEAMEEARKSGVAVSEEFVQTGLMVDDAFDRMGNAVTGVSNKLFEELGPAIADIVDGIAGWIEDMGNAENGVTALGAVADTLTIALRALGVVIGAVGVIISDVWTAALLVIIPPLAMLRALIISINKALSGDFSGAMDAWSSEVDNALGAMERQVQKAKEVRQNYADFLGETLGVTDQNAGAQTGPNKGDEEGMKRLEALKEQQARQAAARAEAEKRKRENEMRAAAREAQRIARERAAFEIEMLNNQQDKVQDDHDAWITLQQSKLRILGEVYGADSRQYQAAIGEKERFEREWAQRQQAIAMIGADSRRAVTATQIQQDREAAQTRIDIERQRLDTMRSMGIIDDAELLSRQASLNEQEYQQEVALQNRLFQLEMQGLQSQLSVLNLKPEEKAKIDAQIEQLQADHVARMAALSNQQAITIADTQNQAAQQSLASWQRVTQPIGDAFNGMFQNLYNGTVGFKDAMLQAADQILFSFVQMGINMAAQWAAQQLAMTAATTAGVATRTAAETAGATASATANSGSALLQIMNYAWTAAAGAFSAMAGIPVVGPVLAVSAAAAALAAVVGMAGSIASAEGGWDRVPKDGQIAKLHEDEMVLPSNIASPLRDMLSGWGPGSSPRSLSAATADNIQAAGRMPGSTYQEGDTNLTYSPTANVMNQSLRQQLRAESMSMRKWFKNQVRNGALDHSRND